MNIAPRRSTWENYLIAVFAVGLGLLLRVPAWSVLGTTVPFLTFFPAVMISAWRGGFGPGVFSTVLSAIAALFFFVEPLGTIEITRATDAVGVVLFLGVGAFISWITDRMQRTGERLKVAQEAERRLRLLSEQTLAGIGDAVIATDTEGRITFMNTVAEKLTGWAFGDGKGKPLDTVFNIVNEATGMPVESPVVKVLREGIVQGLANHTELIARDGRHAPIDDSGAPIRDEMGALVGAVLVFRDITERRTAERQLQASREELRSTLESITDAFCTLERDWNITYINHAAEQLLGSSRDELLGKNHWETFPASRGTIVEESYRRAVSEQRAVRFEHYYAPLRVWLEVNAYPTDAGGIAIYFRDTTQRKRTEERDAFLVRLDDTVRPLTDAYEITQTSARLLGEHLHADRCAYADVEADEFTFNLTGDYTRAVPSIVGRYTVAQFGEEFAKLCREGVPYVVEDAETDPRVTDVREAYQRTGIRAVISVPLHKAGRFVAGMAVHQTTPREWQEYEVELVRTVANRCWESIERAHVARELAEREQRFRTLAQTIPQLIWTARADGSVDYLSDQWADYIGLPPERLFDWSWQEVTHPDDLPQTIREWKRSIETGEPVDIRHRFRHRTGQWRWQLVRGVPMRDEAGQVTKWVGTCTDIHEATLAEDALRRANRELEEFAYVASHDLQEPLRMVNIYTQQILRRFVPDQPDAKQYAGFVQRGVSRMQQLIHDLLNFSRTVHEGSLPPAGIADLSVSLAEALSVLQRRIEENGATVTAGPLPIVCGDTQQLAHVFENLIGNSLKYRKPDVAPAICITATRADGKYVIAVSDNGIGFEPQYADQIFGLFKRLHKDEYPGTGLGLAICQRIVERYGGSMWADGRPGDGATLFFALPAAEVQ